ncbi:hypothetical protein FIBSPDRAFT_967914, partial [Athelia psychrophila]
GELQWGVGASASGGGGFFVAARLRGGAAERPGPQGYGGPLVLGVLTDELVMRSGGRLSGLRLRCLGLGWGRLLYLQLLLEESEQLGHDGGGGGYVVVGGYAMGKRRGGGQDA